MKKIIILLISILLLGSISTGFAYTDKSNFNYEKLERNYQKALKELEAKNYVKNHNLEKGNKDKIKDEILSNLISDDKSVNYIKNFDENDTTLVVSEEGYGIATIDGDYLFVIDYKDGKKNELKLKIKDLVNGKSKKNNEATNESNEIVNQEEVNVQSINIDVPIQPYSETYESSLDSYKGYYEFYERRATGNYRYFRLTIPSSSGSGASLVKSRSTSSTSQQPFEVKAYDFLSQLELAIDTASSLKDDYQSLYIEMLSSLPGAKEYSTVVSAVLGFYETASAFSSSGFKSGLITLVKNVAAISSDYIANVNTFVTAGMALSNSVVYRVQLSNLNSYYISFCNA
ncbi:hypothetical protein [Thermotalea metallivorans]|uniref:Uncharacterized protein n=1 Tax=Thermotalea metallivorans TaxID=520762 RepID=A0A140LEG5_9FIRM|nr:hypothetical protein [Thermotalea metallivorans]KXG78940.1 hypothetical protein AN619_01000 [Thermotalea metallivorans]